MYFGEHLEDITGGGNGYYSGGGATHIATTSGLLSTLSSKKDKILIVSGGGGGSGFYGGASGDSGACYGGGGSSYIGNSLLSDKAMYCYNCTASNDTNTKTISTTCNETTSTANCAKKGNGYAKITLVSAN